MERKLLEVGEAAEALRIGKSVLYRLLMAGEVASIKVGGRRLVPVSAIDSYIDAQLKAQATSAA